MRRIAVTIAAVALLAASCQSASEQLVEQIAEQTEGVNDVSIDADSGQVSIDTDDGSVTVGGGEVPPNLGVPLPDGYEVQAVAENSDGASVNVAYAQDRYDELVAFYDDWTASQADEFSRSTSTFEQGDDTIRTTGWNSSSVLVTVVDCLTFDSDGFDKTCVQVVTY